MALLVQLNAIGLCNFNWNYEEVCFLYNVHETEEKFEISVTLKKSLRNESAIGPEQAKIRMAHPERLWMGVG
jgi:hypothetical protein